MSIDEHIQAWKVYCTLGRLLKDLGCNEAEDKSVEPSHIVEFLGIIFNLFRMTIHVLEQKIREIVREL